MLAVPAVGVGALATASDLITAGVVFAGLVALGRHRWYRRDAGRQNCPHRMS
jgi:hypothetical protein